MFHQSVIEKLPKKALVVLLILVFASMLNSCIGSNNWADPGAAFNTAPTAVIASPLAGNISDEGAGVTFTGTGQDPEEGVLVDVTLVWTSDLDGQLGTGSTFNITALSRGAHVITLTATDASGATGTASITITVRTPWRDPQWGYRQQIRISSAMTQADQANYPALIKITDQTNPLFGNALSNGDDILFTDLDGVIQLPHEIEFFRDTGSKQLYAWVRISNLSSSSDTVIYIYYGNGGAANQENAVGVWDSNFLAVWHMNEDPSVSTDCNGGVGTKEVCDSTNTYHGDSCSIWNCTTMMSSGDQVPGQIGGSLNFDGANDWIELGTPLVIQTNFTIEGWMNLRNISPPPPPSAGKPSIIGRAWNWHFQVHDSGRLWFRRWSPYQNGLSTTVLSTDRWYHVVVTLATGTTDNLNIYIDGVPEPVSSMIAPVNSAATWALRMAREQGPPDIDDYDGFLDEMRMSDTVRSPEWINASFLNQNDPGTGDGGDPDVYTTFAIEEVN